MNFPSKLPAWPSIGLITSSNVIWATRQRNWLKEPELRDILQFAKFALDNTIHFTYVRFSPNLYDSFVLPDYRTTLIAIKHSILGHFLWKILYSLELWRFVNPLAGKWLSFIDFETENDAVHFLENIRAKNICSVKNMEFE